MIENPSEKDEIYLANVAKIGDSTENILYIEDVLSQDEHAILLNFVKTRDEWNHEPWGSKTVRSSEIPEEISTILYKVFTLFYEKAKSFYDVEVDFFVKDRVTLFKFVEGFDLPLHVDILSDEALHIASVYYINDDYTGGEINFPDHNIKIKPKSNSLVIFPGNENYEHEVLKIVNGNRFSSALWLKFTGSTFYEKKEWYNYK
jgi:hypothetical protein